MPVRLGETLLEPGARGHHLVPLGRRPDGSQIGMPLIAVQGARPGPTLGIIAGIHGDEYEGPEAVRLLLAELDPAELRGGIICAPVANVAAYENFHRVGPIDHLDLNRVFPGKSDGSLTERVAAVLVNEVVAQSTALLDLHSAGFAYDLYPYVGFNATPGATGEASFALARAFAVPVLYASTPFPNVLRLEAAKRDIPAILVEIGGEARCDPAGVARMQRGLLNVLRQLGMIAGPLEGIPDTFTVVKAPAGGEFAHVSTGGFIRNRSALGDVVERGQLLGTIVDLYGTPLEEITAHVSGLVLSFRTIPVVRTGDWGYSIVEVIGQTTQAESMTSALGERR
jgi:predicted deacylase